MLISFILQPRNCSFIGSKTILTVILFREFCPNLQSKDADPNPRLTLYCSTLIECRKICMWPHETVDEQASALYV